MKDLGTILKEFDEWYEAQKDECGLTEIEEYMTEDYDSHYVEEEMSLIKEISRCKYFSIFLKEEIGMKDENEILSKNEEKINDLIEKLETMTKNRYEKNPPWWERDD